MTGRRRQVVVAVCVAVGIAILALFVILSEDPCGVAADLPCGPADEAAALVPADAYAYLHLQSDPESEQAEAMTAIANRLPQLSQVAAEAIAAAVGRPAALGLLGSVGPWLGDEAALAAVRGRGGEPSPLVLFAVGDASGASSFASRLGGGAGRPVSYRGAELTVYPGGLTTTVEDGFLLLGTPFVVRSAIDAAADGNALAADSAAEEVRLALPDERLADLYVSDAGVGALLEGMRGTTRQLDTFIDLDATEGVGVSLTAQDDGLGVDVVSLLDPERTAVEPGFFAAFPDFSPEAAQALGPGTLALVDFGDPAQTVQGLLDQASAASPALAGAFDRLAAQLRRGGVDVEEGLLSQLRGEAAIAFGTQGGRPQATFLAGDVDEEKILPAVAQLQAPLIEALNPVQTGQAPTFSEEQIAGVTAQSLRLTPLIDLTYAVKDGTLAVATDPAGVEDALGGGPALAADPAYAAVAPPPGSRISALVFIDIAGLARVAEPQAFARIRSYARFRAEIRRLAAFGLTVRSDEDRLQTSAFLNIK
jgi:hypothetical protein